MATLLTGPFDTVSFSSAAQRDMNDAFMGTGYVAGVGSELKVAANATPMIVDVPDGRAIIKGALFEILSGTGNSSLSIAANGTGSIRIDRVVVRLTLTGSPYTIALAVVTGTTTAPALTRSATVYEISLAQIAVPIGAGAATVITSGMITDERGDSTVCGPATTRATGLYAPEYPLSESPFTSVLTRSIPGAAATVTPASGKMWEVFGYLNRSGGTINLGNASSPTFIYHYQGLNLSTVEFARPFVVGNGTNIYLPTGVQLLVREYTADSTITPVFITLDGLSGTNYTVPTGYRLKVLRGANNTPQNNATNGLMLTELATTTIIHAMTPHTVYPASSVYYAWGVGSSAGAAFSPADPQPRRTPYVPAGRVINMAQTGAGAAAGSTTYLMGVLEAATAWTFQNS